MAEDRREVPNMNGGKPAEPYHYLKAPAPGVGTSSLPAPSPVKVSEPVGLPKPTRDMEKAKADFDQAGLCIIPDALAPDELAEIRAALYRAAEFDRRMGLDRYDRDADDVNQRIWNLPRRDPVFMTLVNHPAALTFVRHALGWPALLSNISANITGPGGCDMHLHCDQQDPHDRINAINVMWCVDDFTDMNGATQVIPGSHRYGRGPKLVDDTYLPSVPLEAAAGSMMVMDGRIWHKTGFNRTQNERRAGIFGYYVKPTFMPQENWWLSMDQETIRQCGSEDLQVLFGYRVLGPFGRVNGRSPI